MACALSAMLLCSAGRQAAQSLCPFHFCWFRGGCKIDTNACTKSFDIARLQTVLSKRITPNQTKSSQIYPSLIRPCSSVRPLLSSVSRANTLSFCHSNRLDVLAGLPASRARWLVGGGCVANVGWLVAERRCGKLVGMVWGAIVSLLHGRSRLSRWLCFLLALVV